MSAPASGALDVGDGHQVAWRRAGATAAPPMLLLHGGPGSGLSASLMAQVAAAGWQAIGMDQRGCGESRPHAGESLSALEANTTVHLIADIERLRRHLGVTSWAVFGASWGSTLALAYALFHPDAVRALLLMGVTTSGPGEIDWLYGHAGQCLPEAFARFQRQSGVPGASGRALVAAYRRRLCAPDAATPHAAAEAWCDWERAVAGLDPRSRPSLRWEDPRWRLGFARLVTHYFAHGAWLRPGALLGRAGVLAGLPVTSIHSRLDLAAPFATAWAVHRAIPGSRLIPVAGALHGAGEAAMSEILEAELSGLRQRLPAHPPLQRNANSDMSRHSHLLSRPDGQTDARGIAGPG